MVVSDVCQKRPRNGMRALHVRTIDHASTPLHSQNGCAEGALSIINHYRAMVTLAAKFYTNVTRGWSGIACVVMYHGNELCIIAPELVHEPFVNS